MGNIIGRTINVGLNDTCFTHHFLNRSQGILTPQKEHNMETGIELITEERMRQISKEGWTFDHDDEHIHGELSAAAACYAINKHKSKVRVHMYREAENTFLSGNTGDRGDRRLMPEGWYDAFPWEEWDKRFKHNQIKSLQIAGALIAAEIDRLQRIKPNKGAE